MLIFSTIESSVNKSGQALKLFSKQLSDVKRDFSSKHGMFKGVFSGGINKSDFEALKKYNSEIESGIAPSNAYKNNLLNVSSAAKKTSVEIAKGTKSIDDVSTALKATSLSSQAAAVGMKALSVAMNMAVMLSCLNNHCFILIVKGGININQLKKSCSLKELKDCEVALLGVKENEHIITKKIIKKYKRKIKSNSFKLKISVLLSDIGIKCKNIKAVD